MTMRAVRGPGRFVLAVPLQDIGFDRRFAPALLRPRWARRTPARLLAAVGTCMLSLCPS